MGWGWTLCWYPMLCQQTGTVLGVGCSDGDIYGVSPCCPRVDSTLLLRAVAPCWDAISSVNATSSPHVQTGKTTLSIPQLSGIPLSQEPGRGKATDSPHHTVSQQQDWDRNCVRTLCLLATLHASWILSFKGRNGVGSWEEGTGSSAGVCSHPFAQQHARCCLLLGHALLPLRFRRKGRLGWGLPGQGLGVCTAELHASHQSCLRREETLRACAERAALLHGSLMGCKFLRRIVAC